METTDIMSLSTYPLYDRLYQITNNMKLQSAEIKQIIKNIGDIDHSGKEHIYIIIRIYSLRNSGCGVFDLPYGIKKIENQMGKFDISFDILQLPVDLQRMLLMFTKMHLETQTVNSV
jgi:hypothetical protein